MIGKENLVSRFPLLTFLTLCIAAPVHAQSLDDLKLQVHGFATQGFLVSTRNSWNTTDSENGSASWNEDVVNVTAQPAPSLRVGVQARFFLLGDFGNVITIDWAQGDYQVNDRLGVRFGKVKTPVGLSNDSQDIDPAQLWVLLPQSVYPIASRNSDLAHYGGVVYGKLPLGESFGSVEYRGFAGQRVLASDDGNFQPLHDLGVTTPNGTTGPVRGATLRWNPPVPNLVLGASYLGSSTSGEIDTGDDLTGDVTVAHLRQSYFFGRYERERFSIAGEFSRTLGDPVLTIAGAPFFAVNIDRRAFYAMATVKPSARLTGGLYYSSLFDHRAALGPARFQKDWALAARYDFNSFLYAKLEQHFLDGTAINYALADNPQLSPDSRLTLLKVGVSF